MKPMKLVVTFLSVVAFTVGCKPTERKMATATERQIDQVREKTTEAAADMKDYAFAQKAEFVEKMQIQLAEINGDLDQLSAKIEKAGDAARAEARPKLQALREQVAGLNRQLDEARNASESTWSEVKAGFKKGYGELKEGFQNARQWVGDKIAP